MALTLSARLGDTELVSRFRSAPLLLNLFVIRPTHLRFLHPVNNVFVTLLGITILIGLWAEPDVSWYARLLGVQGVLVAAMTLMIPVLARFSSSSSSRLQEANCAATAGRPALIRFCPSCGRPVAPRPLATETPTVCDTCGLAFEVSEAPDFGAHSVAGNSRGEPGDG